MDAKTQRSWERFEKSHNPRFGIQQALAIQNKKFVTQINGIQKDIQMAGWLDTPPEVIEEWDLDIK
jgi:hypothetical protein